MKVAESSLKKDIRKIITLEQGPVYIFDQFVITEFNQGITVDEDCFLNLLQILENASVEKEHFGFISNRVNSYAVDAFAYKKVTQYAIRTYTSAFVIYTKRMEIAVSFEEYVYSQKLSIFSEMETAIKWLYSEFSKPKEILN